MTLSDIVVIRNQTAQRDRSMERANKLAAKYQELSSRPDSPKVWRQQHAQQFTEREQHVAALTHERDGVRAQAIEHHVHNPKPHLTRVLGERPAEPERLQVWERGARAIEAYRHEHGVTDRNTALGREPEGDYKRWLAFDKARADAVRAYDQLSRQDNQLARGQVAALAVMRPGHGRGFSIER